LAAGGVYTWPLVGAWLLGVCAWLAVWWPLNPALKRRAEKPSLLKEASPLQRALLPQPGALAPGRGEGRTLLLLALILLVAAFFRFYRLDDVPHDPTSDHAEKLLDVLDLVHGQRPIFFERNTGREPAQFYWSYALICGFGFPLSWQTLKWGTALIGLAAVPAIFLVGRELRDTAAGLLAALLFAIGKWPVNISRMGLRFPLAILPAALVVWLLLRYMRRIDRRDALLCGLLIGAGLHGYISFRIVPLLVPLFWGIGLLMDRRLRRAWRAVLADGALLAATAVLACLPLARYAVDHPEQVWYRVTTRIGDAENPLGAAGKTLRTFVDNNRRALLAFNVRGDVTSVNAVSHDPFLDPVTGAALVAGVVVAGYRAVRRRDPRFAAMLLALPILLLPSTLSISFPIENPSANRMGVAAVVVFPLAARPFTLVPRLLPRRTMRIAAAATFVLLLAVAVRHNYVRYFHDYDLQYRAAVPNTGTIAAMIRERIAQGIPLDNVYMLAFPHWLDGRNLAFALGDITWKARHDIPVAGPLPQRTPGGPMLFLLHAQDDARRDQLRHAFPDGSNELIVPPDGKSFQLYTVP